MMPRSSEGIIVNLQARDRSPRSGIVRTEVFATSLKSEPAQFKGLHRLGRVWGEAEAARPFGTVRVGDDGASGSRSLDVDRLDRRNRCRGPTARPSTGT